MSTELLPYQGLELVLYNLNGVDHVEFNLTHDARIYYQDKVFQFDAVIGYARDLRLIEYRVEDKPGFHSEKTIFVYRYGTHPDGTFGIEKRGPHDPSGNWQRFFRDMPQQVFQRLTQGDWSGTDNPIGSGPDLPARKSKRKLLGQTSERFD